MSYVAAVSQRILSFNAQILVIIERYYRRHKGDEDDDDDRVDCSF